MVLFFVTSGPKGDPGISGTPGAPGLPGPKGAVGGMGLPGKLVLVGVGWAWAWVAPTYTTQGWRLAGCGLCCIPYHGAWESMVVHRWIGWAHRPVHLAGMFQVTWEAWTEPQVSGRASLGCPERGLASAGNLASGVLQP